MKFIKKLSNGYLVQELILTKEGLDFIKNNEKQDDENKLSDEGVFSTFVPYDTVKKISTPEKKYVSFYTQYFKKDL